jgi:hypothetical protein
MHCPLCQAESFEFIDVDESKPIRKYVDTQPKVAHIPIQLTPMATESDEISSENPQLNLIPQFEAILIAASGHVKYVCNTMRAVRKTSNKINKALSYRNEHDKGSKLSDYNGDSSLNINIVN